MLHDQRQRRLCTRRLIMQPTGPDMRHTCSLSGRYSLPAPGVHPSPQSRARLLRFRAASLLGRPRAGQVRSPFPLLFSNSACSALSVQQPLLPSSSSTTYRTLGSKWAANLVHKSELSLGQKLIPFVGLCAGRPGASNGAFGSFSASSFPGIPSSGGRAAHTFGSASRAYESETLMKLQKEAERKRLIAELEAKGELGDDE